MEEHSSWVAINLANLKHNLAQFKKTLKPQTKTMAVVKANAYGHGIAAIAKEAEKLGVDWLGTVNSSEALKLRKAGIKKPILVLSFVDTPDLADLVGNNISLGIYDANFLKELARAAQKTGQRAKVHLKVDTGTSRLGLLPKDAIALGREIIKTPEVELEGVFTHFASSEEADKSYTLKQQARFGEVVDGLKKEKKDFLVHSSCSASVFTIPETQNDLVRLGIGLYGLWPSPTTRAAVENGITLKPLLSWKTRVIQVKDLPAKTFIGYGNTYQLAKAGKIAVLPLGYWDGYDRLLSNTADVLIRGQRAPVRGRVCMNLTMVEITDIPSVHVGDEAVLIGNQGEEEVTADELAEKAQTINYEIVTRINPQLPRIYAPKTG